jgi:hypothetical protein
MERVSAVLLGMSRVLAVAVVFDGRAFAQETPGSASTISQDAANSPNAARNPWSFSLTADGYFLPHGRSYVTSTVTADRSWLHLEARYNSENLDTGSLWAGYNFSAGHTLVLQATPMIGGVFGKTTGIAPGYEISLAYKRVLLSTQGEYVFDTADRSGSFLYTWSTLGYSPTKWFRAGIVVQRTKAFHTGLAIQRGFLVGLSRKRVAFTTYVFNLGWTDPTLVFEVAFH